MSDVPAREDLRPTTGVSDVPVREELRPTTGVSDVPTRVKICGITGLHDAELATALGAWAIGMVFYEGSPRRCSIEQALRITTALHRREVELCGVFVDATLDELAHRAEELGLTMLQLHGDEGPSFCAEAARRTGARVIKAMQIAGAGDVRELERYHVDFHLADARSSAPGPRVASGAPGAGGNLRAGGAPWREGDRGDRTRRGDEATRGLRGGTGETFDWDLLASRRSSTPLILSGGLHPGNVAEAIARVRPYAVDTASGTERAPGHKDETKLREFFAAVRAAEAVPDVAVVSA